MRRKREILNTMRVKIPAISENEGLARAVVAAFCTGLDPTLSELSDIKCSVSEAITNCIVHAYGKEKGYIYINLALTEDGEVRIEIRDNGCGIPDVSRAREPLYTTDTTGERSGMGFSVMESFMDSLCVFSKEGKGTRIIMTKRISQKRKR